MFTGSCHRFPVEANEDDLIKHALSLKPPLEAPIAPACILPDFRLGNSPFPFRFSLLD